MMKNKKLAALLGLLLAGSMTVSMAACGSTNSASDTDTNSGSDTNSATDTGTKLQSIYRKCHCRSCIQLGRKSGLRMGSM